MDMANTSSSRFRRTMIGAATAGASGCALMTGNAAIIYSGEQNLSTSTRVGTVEQPDIKPINLDGFGEDEFSLYSFWNKGYDFHWEMDSSHFFLPVRSYEHLDNGVFKRLPFGEMIDSNQHFRYESASQLMSNNSNMQWFNGIEGYFGFAFKPNGIDDDNYGWGRLRISNDYTTITLVDWAYQNSGAGIPAGAVPEPATGLLVAASVISAVCWKFGRRVASNRSS